MNPLFSAFVECLEKGSGLSPQEAERLALTALTWGAENGHAGDTYYWPQNLRTMSTDEIRTRIREEFTGGQESVRQLSETYGVSRSFIYQAVAER